MKVSLTNIIWVSIIMLFVSSALNAQNSQANKRTEGVINYELSKDDYNFFREFDSDSSQEKAFNLISDIVKAADSNFIELMPWHNFVVHISLGGINKTIYLKKYLYSTSEYVHIKTNSLLGYDNFWGIYITDQSDYLASSIEVSIAETKAQYIQSSILTSPNTVEIYGKALGPREIELGIKLFEFPDISSFLVNFVFVQRDIETNASQSWKRSFSVRRPRSYRYDFGIMIPVTKISFDPASNVDEISAVLTLSFGIPIFYRRVEETKVGLYNFYWKLINPDIVLGLGYPFDIVEESFWANSLFLGLKWHLPFDFLNVTFGRINSSNKSQNVAGFTISLIPFAKLLSD